MDDNDLSFPTLQRGNAGRDALRRKRGRRASRTACDAERRTIVTRSAWISSLNAAVFSCPARARTRRAGRRRRCLRRG
ncbi:hypothetical protein CTI37_18515 [Pseudomonas syringae pv. actinidiae]|nr:hypothetical protein CTI37_18515 [Pseudomonas syringae pv. actinidiae]